MDVNKAILSVVSISVKVIIAAIIILFVYKGGSMAYDFGRDIFLNEAIAEKSDAREVKVTVPKGASVTEIGKLLEQKGLIKDSTIFKIQTLLYEDGRKMQGGTYTLNTSMTPTDMMTVLAEGEQDETANGE